MHPVCLPSYSACLTCILSHGHWEPAAISEVTLICLLQGLQLAEGPVQAGPDPPEGGEAADHLHAAGPPPAGVGLVGRRPPHQLLRRLAHGVRPLMCITHPRRDAPSLQALQCCRAEFTK